MLKRRRSFLTGACFVFALAALALIGTFSPSYQKCAADHERTQAQNEQPDLHKHVAGRVHIPLFWLCEGAFIDENNGTLGALATIAIAAFTLTLWRATTEHGRLTREVLDLARDEFNATHRPRLRVYAFEVADRDLPHDRPITVLFQVRNVGETNARLIKLEGCIRIEARRDRHLEPGIPFRDIKDLDITLVSGEREAFQIEDGTTATEENATSIYANQTPILCIGRITYEDGSGNKRETGFCRELSLRPIQSSRPRADTEYEYED